MSSDLDALYKNARICLWVEDIETRVWLEALWLGFSPVIRLLVAGGQDNVEAVCRQAADVGYPHVFGVVDLDYGKSNRSRWAMLTPTERVYRLDVHEVENLMLDAEALAKNACNTAKREPAAVESKLLEILESRLCWVALKTHLADTRFKATQHFPPVKNTVATLEDAERHLLENEWFKIHASGCPKLVEPASVRAGLLRAHEEARRMVLLKTWQQHFPGKEVLRDLQTFLYHKGRGDSGRQDLIKAIARWQRENDRVPEQIVALRAELLRRVAQ